MARFQRRPRQSHPIAELNVTNLIDLGFTLLIIFMIATPLINQEQKIDVNLPFESRSATQKPPPGTKFVTITVRERGEYFIEHEKVTLADLTKRIRILAANPANVVVRVRGDANAPYQHVISVIDILKQNNLMKLSLDTQAGS